MQPITIDVLDTSPSGSPWHLVISRSRLRSASSNHYEVSRTRLKFGDRAFSIAEPTAWNSLPKEIMDIPRTERFKAQLETYLCILTYIAIFLINYVIRLWSQDCEVTHFTIFGCERCIRKCASITYYHYNFQFCFRLSCLPQPTFQLLLQRE